MSRKGGSKTGEARIFRSCRGGRDILYKIWEGKDKSVYFHPYLGDTVDLVPGQNLSLKKLSAPTKEVHFSIHSAGDRNFHPINYTINYGPLGNRKSEHRLYSLRQKSVALIWSRIHPIVYPWQVKEKRQSGAAEYVFPNVEQDKRTLYTFLLVCERDVDLSNIGDVGVHYVLDYSEIKMIIVSSVVDVPSTLTGSTLRYGPLDIDGMSYERASAPEFLNLLIRDAHLDLRPKLLENITHHLGEEAGRLAAQKTAGILDRHALI